MNLSELKKLIKEEVGKALTPHLEKIKPNEIKTILGVGDKAFGNFKGYEKTVSQHPNINYYTDTDWNKSIKLVLGEEIIGYYLLSDKQSFLDFLNKTKKYGLTTIINDKDLFDFAIKNKGIEGLSVGILPEYKGKGLSKLLFDYPKSLSYPFIWAIQTKGMSNLEGWLKRANLVVTFKHDSGQEFYITVERF